MATLGIRRRPFPDCFLALGSDTRTRGETGEPCMFAKLRGVDKTDSVEQYLKIWYQEESKVMPGAYVPWVSSSVVLLSKPPGPSA